MTEPDIAAIKRKESNVTTETLTPTEALGVALSVAAPTMLMGDAQAGALAMLAHLEAMGFRVVTGTGPTTPDEDLPGYRQPFTGPIGSRGDPTVSLLADTPSVEPLERNADIERIAAIVTHLSNELHEVMHRDPPHTTFAAALYDAGLRPSVEPAGLTATEWADFLDGDEGVWHDRFGLWVQGKRDTAWLAERLAALLPTQASDSPEKP